MKSFRRPSKSPRKLAASGLAKDSAGPEGLFLSHFPAGMESNPMIRKKEHLEALKRLKEASVQAKALLAPQAGPPTTRTLLWHANTLSEAFREVIVPPAPVRRYPRYKSSAWNPWKHH